LIRKIVSFLFVLFFAMGCQEDKGRLKVWLTDAPPPQNVQNIYITVLGVGIRNAGGDVTTLQNDIHRIDILELVGGFAAPLTFSYTTGSNYVDVEPGDYTSVLLVLAQINSLVMEGDSIADSLLIPEGMPIEFEINEEFIVLPGEHLTIVVDFDASKSINWEAQPYELNPYFKAFQTSNAGFICGRVKTLEDTLEVGVKFAVLHAVSFADSMTTLSDSAGNYSLFIPEGTYDISVSADGYTISDTIYEGIVLEADSILENYNFTLE
jgi:hypothetical protein